MLIKFFSSKHKSIYREEHRQEIFQVLQTLIIPIEVCVQARRDNELLTQKVYRTLKPFLYLPRMT